MVEASQKSQDAGIGNTTAYIKITLDDKDNPTSAKVEYRLKCYYYYSSSRNEIYKIDYTAIYEGTLYYDDLIKDITPQIPDFFY